MMKAFCAATALTIAGSSFAAPREPSQASHRYLIERTFPAGAIDGVDAAAKKKVNENNSTLDVTWEKSYANADKTKTLLRVRRAERSRRARCGQAEWPAGRQRHRDSGRHQAGAARRGAAHRGRQSPLLVKRAGAAGRQGRRQRREVRRDAAHFLRDCGQADRTGYTKRPASRRWKARPRPAAHRSNRSRRFRRRCTRTERRETGCYLLAVEVRGPVGAPKDAIARSRPL